MRRKWNGRVPLKLHITNIFKNCILPTLTLSGHEEHKGNNQQVASPIYYKLRRKIWLFEFKFDLPEEVIDKCRFNFMFFHYMFPKKTIWYLGAFFWRKNRYFHKQTDSNAIWQQWINCGRVELSQPYGILADSHSCTISKRLTWQNTFNLTRPFSWILDTIRILKNVKYQTSQLMLHLH